jgi:hypothetical protein
VALGPGEQVEDRFWGRRDDTFDADGLRTQARGWHDPSLVATSKCRDLHPRLLIHHLAEVSLVRDLYAHTQAKE